MMLPSSRKMYKNKLLIVGSVAAAALLIIAAIGSNNVVQQALAQSCNGGNGVNVQVCNNQVCATVSVISKDVSTRCS